MSLLVPCSHCAQKAPGKLSNLTWAWYVANGDRLAYRQKLCLTCTAQYVVPLLQDYGVALTCPGCGAGTVDDMDPVFLTAYWPDVGRQAYEFPTCASCAVGIRIRAQQGSEKLDSRPLASGGQDPDSGPQIGPSAGAWEALGLRPPR